MHISFKVTSINNCSEKAEGLECLWFCDLLSCSLLIIPCSERNKRHSLVKVGDWILWLKEGKQSCCNIRNEFDRVFFFFQCYLDATKWSTNIPKSVKRELHGCVARYELVWTAEASCAVRFHPSLPSSKLGLDFPSNLRRDCGICHCVIDDDSGGVAFGFCATDFFRQQHFVFFPRRCIVSPQEPALCFLWYRVIGEARDSPSPCVEKKNFSF